MHRSLYATLVCILLLVALFGCNAAQECNAGPCLAATTAALATATPPAATAAPTATIPPTVAPTATPVNYDGLWDGSTNDGALIGSLQFMIDKNKVTEISFNYTLRNGGCTYISSLGGTADESSIGGDKIHATMFIRGGNILTFDGTFTADKQAQGTLTYKGTLQDCGPFEKTSAWNAKNIPIPPTLTPTPIPPTATPTLTPTATKPLPTKPVVEPTMESRDVPTIVPTLDTRNVPEEIKPLVNAISKTRGATTFRLEQEFVATGLSAEPKATPETISFSQFDEIFSPNRHTLTKGMLATTYGADPEKGFEYILANGKAYVHGPATRFNAPEEKWYELASVPRDTLDVSPLFILDFPTLTGGNWNSFERSAGNVSLDGQMCEVYVAGQNAFGEILPAFTEGQAEPAIDQGNVELYVCSDGFLHKIQLNIATHDQKDATKKNTFEYTFHLYDVNNISVQPPRDFVAFGAGTPPSPNQTRTPAAYDTEFPLPENVQNFDSGGTYEGQINYQTDLSLATVVAFYRKTLAAKGIVEDTRMATIDDRGFSIVFNGWKPGKWLVIQGVDLGDLRNVNMRLEDAR